MVCFPTDITGVSGPVQSRVTMWWSSAWETAGRKAGTCSSKGKSVCYRQWAVYSA